MAASLLTVQAFSLYPSWWRVELTFLMGEGGGDGGVGVADQLDEPQLVEGGVVGQQLGNLDLNLKWSWEHSSSRFRFEIQSNFMFGMILRIGFMPSPSQVFTPCPCPPPI